MAIIINDVETIRSQWLQRYDGKTQKQASFALLALDSFVKRFYSNNLDLLVAYCKGGGEEQRYLVLDSLIRFWIELGFSPSTIRNYFSFTRSYLRRYGIKTYKEDLREFVKMPKRIKERKEPLSKDVIKRIMNISDSKYKVLWSFLAVTGMRIGEALVCSKGWLDPSFIAKYGLCLVKIPALDTKESSERYTFLTKPVWELVKPYYNSRILDTDPLLDISYNAAEEYMSWIRGKLGLNDKYTTGVHKITCHSFRSFTRTVLSDKCGMEFAYYILGQEGYLPEYYRKSYEDGAILFNLAKDELNVL